MHKGKARKLWNTRRQENFERSVLHKVHEHQNFPTTQYSIVFRPSLISRALPVVHYLRSLQNLIYRPKALLKYLY